MNIITRKKNKYKLPNNLEKIFDVLEDNNVFFWLDAGSMLKGIRDGSIITSSDIDISVHANQTKNVLNAIRELKHIGYKVNYNGGYPMLEDMVTIYLPKKINRIEHLDIYIFHKHKNNYIRRCFHKPLADSKSRYLFYLSKKILNKMQSIKSLNDFSFGKKILFYSGTIFGKIIFYLYEFVGKTSWYIVPELYFLEFKKITLHERNFNIPREWDKYLNLRYGNDWELEKNRKEWFQTWKSDKNHIIRHKRLIRILSFEKYWL